MPNIFWHVAKSASSFGQRQYNSLYFYFLLPVITTVYGKYLIIPLKKQI